MVVIVIVNVSQVIGISIDQREYIEKHLDGASPGDVLEYLGAAETV